MPDHINPIRILINHAATHPRAITIAEVIIDYCIRQARFEKDPHFLLPVRRCLHDLTDPTKPYSEIALKSLRGFGLFPARGRRVILDYHVIAHPYEFRWRFWKPNSRGLHQYKNQVLQISPNVSPASPKDNFTRDIFTASFDMLWHRTGPVGEPSEEPVATKVQGPNLFSWPMAFIAVIRRKLKVTHNATVECHSFDAAALDNPALSALVEYKWYLSLFFHVDCVTTLFLAISGTLLLRNLPLFLVMVLHVGTRLGISTGCSDSWRSAFSLFWCLLRSFCRFTVSKTMVPMRASLLLSSSHPSDSFGSKSFSSSKTGADTCSKSLFLLFCATRLLLEPDGIYLQAIDRHSPSLFKKDPSTTRSICLHSYSLSQAALINSASSGCNDCWIEPTRSQFLSSLHLIALCKYS